MYKRQSRIIRENGSLCFIAGSSVDFLFGCGRSILDHPRPARVRARCLMRIRMELEVFQLSEGAESKLNALTPRTPLPLRLEERRGGVLQENGF